MYINKLDNQAKFTQLNMNQPTPIMVFVKL